MGDGIDRPQNIEALPASRSADKHPRKAPQHPQKGRQDKVSGIDKKHHPLPRFRLFQTRF
jgi:hypothetical protein